MEKIYLDNQSNTKIDIRVFEAMYPFFLENYGNPQSIYSLGSISKEAVEKARTQAANLINAQTSEIIFTSCGTESNNLALKGLAKVSKSKGRRILISSVEHISVLNSAKQLEKDGFEVIYIPVDSKGFVDQDILEKSLTKDVILVSIQYANPEIGTIQNIKELTSIVKKNSSALFHTDAVSACGVIPVDVKELGVDALSFSSSVMYGPKGVAALFLKQSVKIESLLSGGIQENSRRSGTENVPAIVGFGKACEVAVQELDSNLKHLKNLSSKLIEELPKRIEHIYLNGPFENRLPGNINFSVEFVEGEALFLLLDAKGIMAASGSACANKNLKISTVLSAINTDVALGQGSILFTLSKFNTQEEMDFVLEEFPKIILRLRDMSPLYSHFLKTGQRKAAGPGTDFDDHDYCEIE
ncbi:MAG: cysteine desulfurase [Elusimicrobiota bacterium]|jgi:cysteine desulfurase|nr:cysteine desulfurase [Elusimicrobiota bacterium]